MVHESQFNSKNVIEVALTSLFINGSCRKVYFNDSTATGWLNISHKAELKEKQEIGCLRQRDELRGRRALDCNQLPGRMKSKMNQSLEFHSLVFPSSDGAFMFGELFDG